MDLTRACLGNENKKEKEIRRGGNCAIWHMNKVDSLLLLVQTLASHLMASSPFPQIVNFYYIKAIFIRFFRYEAVIIHRVFCCEVRVA